MPSLLKVCDEVMGCTFFLFYIYVHAFCTCMYAGMCACMQVFMYICLSKACDDVTGCPKTVGGNEGRKNAFLQYFKICTHILYCIQVFQSNMKGSS